MVDSANRATPRWWPRRRHNSYTVAPLILISVNLLLFLTFFVWPAIIGLAYSFTSYTGVGDAPWVGLENYRELIGDTDFYAALLRTLIYTACVVPLMFVMSLGIAYLLVSPYAKGKPIARVIFFLPWLISPIIAGVIWRWLFGENFGLVNFVITELGGDPVSWQSNGDLSLMIVVIVATWAGTAFNMLLFIAALKNVPVSYYEAADLDGANAWQKFRNITLPAIAPTSFIVVLLSTLHAMKEYTYFVAVNDGGPGTENNLIVQYIYETGFKRTQMGYASAASFVLLLILVIVAVLQLIASRRKGS
ncbi:carbohydrate ABC transporter permease [Actinoplanes xinjiangensis]|jgi:alpha-1,4-digalacturonate transport system permease protein|uniref:Carbohydrate ABC transporter membrane protein 1 (CUT1 family) n=1 Tax=Actinoplanes xinjiangensis TaxID=512350 RepID=A0A316FUV1_9ACTN|nr:sugar ABC transporter permease [Actinoplanes xinjiangensis]PWK45171.1 carbohydrate ABC transporter membrane protein 1 (CUT1 family) [Actinoplanes xinjiangensis]GIF41494.1 sugar ABC transporter permease [Actinoplanes xinjiangensis]